MVREQYTCVYVCMYIYLYILDNIYYTCIIEIDSLVLFLVNVSLVLLKINEIYSIYL